MRKFLPYFFSVVLTLWITTPTFAQSPSPTTSQSGSAIVNATVGQFFLNVTGYQSPNASVIIETTSGIFLESTTADGDGYFTISNVLINDTLPGFCFRAVDFKRIGESESCIEIKDVITEDKIYNDIFLPPSIGLSRKVISEGENADIYGYSMPNGEIRITKDEEIITMQADETGYYEFTFENAPAGTYSFQSRGSLSGVDSLEPKNKATLEVLTFQEEIKEDLNNIVGDIEKKFPGAIILVSLFLLFLALLIALLWKTKPQFIMVFFDKFKKRYPMHHDYFLFKE